MKLRLSFVVFVAAIIANLYVFFNREHFQYHNQASYLQLYPVVTGLPVAAIEKVNDSVLKFDFRDKDSSALFQTMVDGSAENISANPEVHLTEGLHGYQLFSASFKDTLLLRAEYVPAGKTATGKAFTAVYRTNAGNTTPGEIKNDISFYSALSQDEQAALKQIIRDSVGINTYMTSQQKAEQIFLCLYSKIGNSRGTPSGEQLSHNAFVQYKEALAGKKIYCGIYSNIFNLFAEASGLVSRGIELKNSFPNVTGSDHVMNEYFSPEHMQWVAVDLMFNNAFYRNANGDLLNAVQVKNTLYTDSTVTVSKVTDDSFTTVKFSNLPADFFDLYGREKNLYIYRTTEAAYTGSVWKKIKKYCTAASWFDVYSDNEILSNRNFYIKQGILLSGGLSMVWFFTSVFLKYRKKKNDRV